ncbi:hypothetical protein BURPS1710b_3142 [Burkholderia pseudomallei 1710b]|uniref:Uncharacterized protein n=1 Tax=Burkholderia pseudomallei (strain 1710b) TaxID=320372 RepID=Q3JPJ0_BURP1|nr:hypothetical protein BURPS1710b_3142 [Burkholderia pseudomallei 1710b]
MSAPVGGRNFDDLGFAHDRLSGLQEAERRECVLRLRKGRRRAGGAEIDDVGRPVAARAPGCREIVQFDGRTLERRRDVDEAGIDADRRRRAIDEADDRGQRQLRRHDRRRAERLREALARRALGVAAPRQHERRAAPHERLAEAGPRFVGPLLVGARGRVHEYHVGHRQIQIERRERARRAMRVEAEIDRLAGRRRGVSQRRRDELPRALDNVRARRDRHPPVVEEAHRPLVAGAVGAVAEADKRPARPARDPRGLDEPLAVDHEVVALLGEAPPERADLAPRLRRAQALAPAPQRERQHVAHTVDEPHEIGEAFLDEPVDLRIGVTPADIGDHRHVMHDIAERRHAHDQNFLHAEKKGRRWPAQTERTDFIAPGGRHRQKAANARMRRRFLDKACVSASSGTPRPARAAPPSSSERQVRVRLRRLQRAPEIVLDPRERRVGARLEAQHDHGRRVRRTRETEAVRILDAQTVDRHDLVRAVELRVGAQLVDQLHVLAFVELQLQLGRRHRVRQAVEQRARIGRAREDLEQARARVEAVVEAVPAILEEHVAAHLARERRARLAQLRLHERVARLPHQRLAALLAHPLREIARALHVVDDLRARVARQHFLGEQHQLAVRIDDLAVLRDDAEAVAVAVEREADLGIGRLQLRDHVLQVLRVRRVRVVVREVAVDVGEELDEFAAERLEQARRERARDAVARIDDELQRPREPDVADDALDVLIGDIVSLIRTVAGLETRVDDALVQALDLVAVNRGAAQDHLETVVVGRIVAARDDDARIDAALAARQRERHARREVADGRRHHADVDDIDARRAQPVRERADELGPREPAVARDDDRVAALRAHFAAECAADRARDVGVERLADHAPNIVCLEDGLGDHRFTLCVVHKKFGRLNANA